MSEEDDVIFGQIPTDAFKLFSGPLRHHHADLLQYLNEHVFVDAGLQVRQDVVSAIRSYQSQHPAPEDTKTDPAIRANMTYARLIETGWLIEHQQGNQRLADFDPSVRILLEFLIDLKAGRMRSYGSEVIQVLSLVESVDRDPEDRSEALRSAAKSAKGFLTHLRTLGAGMCKAETAINALSEPSDVFTSFFGNYVEKHLISDFTALHTKSNPFRFRVRIVVLCNRMLEDELKLTEMARGVMREGRASSVALGRQAVINDVRTIISIFENIDAYLEVIEETNRRVETRIRNTIRFLESIRESQIDKLSRMMREIADLNRDDVPFADGMLQTSLPDGPGNLFQQAERRAEIQPNTVQVAKKTPERVAYEAAVIGYRQRVQKSPDQVGSYLDEQVGKASSKLASELRIDNLDDFFAFQQIRNLTLMVGGPLAQKWRITELDGRLTNAWIECQNFEISRL